jgi:acyl carrier protein
MNDTEILEKVKDWLKSNLENNCFDLDIEEDNKALLDAIEDWEEQKKGLK